MKLISFTNKMALAIVINCLLCVTALAASADMPIPPGEILDSYSIVTEVKKSRFKLMGVGGVKSSARFRFANIQFSFDSAKLTPQSFPQLNEVVSALSELDDVAICVVEGHTDKVGEAAYNAALSKKRALSVKSYLEARLEKRVQIRPEGYGEARPVCSDATESCRQSNRRVEILIK